MINIKSLSKTYNPKNPVEAIKDINLNINKNEFIVFVGKSGCGKTTLLKCMGGLIKPSEGEIKVDGIRITKPNSDIGFVPQDFSLFPWLTVRKNVEFGLRLKKFSDEKINGILNHYLDITNLQNFADMYPKNLSGGMKQRVAIARTLANNPSVILMDEPFGSLDSITRIKMQKFLTGLWEKEQKTIIFVTHDIEEALFLADRIYILSERPGKIIASLKVPFKRPRKLQLKDTSEFSKLKNRLINILENSRQKLLEKVQN